MVGSFVSDLVKYHPTGSHGLMSSPGILFLFFLLKKTASGGRADDSAGKLLAMQVEGPEFKSLAPRKKLSMAEPVISGREAGKNDPGSSTVSQSSQMAEFQVQRGTLVQIKVEQ